MTQKFYLHDATTAVAGTLPSTKIGTSASVGTVAGSATNRVMDATIGVLQTSAALTTVAGTSAQQTWFRRWVSDPVAAQTFGATAAYTASWASSQSSTNSNFNEEWIVAIWRPGTGAIVGRITDNATVFETASAAGGTTQTARTATAPIANLTDVVALDGDIIVVEHWRDERVQSMATAYTNTVFYDGTTEASTTTCASFIDFGADIPMFSAAAAQVPYVNPMPPLLAQ